MKHIRKLTSWLLAIALIFTLMPVVAIRARADEPTWGGTGTIDDPYTIGSKDDLEKFRNIVNGTGEEKNSAACAILTENINLENVEWTPIGDVATGYIGTFDGQWQGQSHSITGLNVSSNGFYSGLFGIIEKGGTVRNVSVSGTVTGSNYVGGIAGYNDKGTVENCSNACTVTGNDYVGGIAGYNDKGTVENCYNTGAVIGNSDNVGGVIGYNDGGTVTNCSNTGSVTGTGNYVGGVVGTNSGTVTNCYNTDAVSGSNTVGGVVGDNSSNGTVTNCYNTGNVTGTGNYVGGVVGNNRGTVENCYNTGSVNGTAYVGGVVGNNSGTVTNCYNTGSVTGTGINVGGVVGYNIGTVTNCYNTGSVGGDSIVGGVIGANFNTVTNCYNTGNVTGESFVGGVVGNNDGTEENCYNTGSVTGTGINVGGVVGYNSGTVTNCYNTGSVTASGDPTTGNWNVGGIAGNNNGTVENCYNIGAVPGNGYAGGVIGYNGNTVTHCYNTGAVSGSDPVGGVIGWGTTSSTVTSCYYRTDKANKGIGLGEGTVIAEPNLEIAVTWSALYDALQSNGSKIVLGADVKYGTGDGDHKSENLDVPSGKTVELDLTGHVIDRAASAGGGSVITVHGDLTITDSKSSEGEPGQLKGGNNASFGGGVIINGGSFTLKGGTISENTSPLGGGVYIYNGGSFTLEGGTISENMASDGGGVYINGGSFTLKGGTISDNTAFAFGGGVFCNGSLYLSGGATISGNYKGTDDKATDYNNNVYLLSTKTITITGELTNTTPPIGVTMYDGTGTITYGLGTTVSGGTTPYGTAANFTSDNTAYGVALDEYGEAYLVPRESTPEAIFTATGADSGELSRLTAGATYSISGTCLTTAKVITADANGKYPITSDLTAGTLSIVKKGNGSTTVDSEAKTIEIGKAPVPTGPANTDGTITGVTTEMEYKKSDAVNWTDGTGSAITGLTPGTYYVRVKASGTTLASDNKELTIADSYKKVTPIGKIGKGEVYMATVLPPGVPTITVSGITTEFAESLLTAEEKTAVLNGAKLTVTLDMKEIGDTVSADVKSRLGDKARKIGGSNVVVGLYLDISLFKEIEGRAKTQVNDVLTKKVSMRLTVPVALRNTINSIIRTFFILRIHENNVDKVGEGTGTEIPFDSDRFSTYALAYSDKQKSSGGGGGTIPYYTVRFEMNGHGTAVASKTVSYGQKVSKPQDPEEEGYTFGGWYSDEALTTEYDFSSAVRKSMTLYAKWEEIRYTVSFDQNGHGSSIETQWVRKNGMAEKPEDPSAEGYSFDGWYGDSDCTKLYDFSSSVTKDITLYAKWVKDVLIYRLYNPNSGAHLFTGNAAENDNLVLIGWEYEGIAWTAPASSKIPVYRVYNPNSGEHHYTMNVAEKAILVALGWNDEGICWYSDENQGTPLYRLYNPNAVGQYAAGAHHYTKDVEERDYLIAAGWNDEGIGWYGK